MEVGNKASILIKFVVFQNVMSELGYDLVSRNPGGGVLFRAQKVALDAGRPSVVVTLEPDFIDQDSGTPAYEKDYVVDLMLQIVNGGDVEGALKILAKRNFHG